MKLEYEKPLSNFAFKTNSRRYNEVTHTTAEGVFARVGDSW